MITVMVTAETCKNEVREGFSLALPKFLWTVLEARAKVMNDGDLNATIQEFVAMDLMEWFKKTIKSGIPVPPPSIN